MTMATMTHPRTIDELMIVAAEALNARDTDTLYNLHRVSGDWLQGADTARAQRLMLESMIDAAEALVAMELI